MDYAQAEFTSEFIQTWQNVVIRLRFPVFIIGMPRFGTTLVEHILASHPRVFGGGELTHLTPSATQVRRPIYSGAIGRWRVHETFLGPLLAELGIADGSNRTADLQTDDREPKFAPSGG